MNTVLRAFNATVDDVNTTERSLVAKINSSRVDYYRTVIDPRGGDFRDYQRSPVVLWCHGKDMKNRGELPVGRNLWIRADKGSDPKVIAKTRFAKDDFSQALYEAYRDGDITGWSLSMVPNEFGPPNEREIRERPELRDCETVYRSWSLAEYSCVPCPGNPDCLTVDEARSLEKVVSRGIAIPDAYHEAIERLSSCDGLASGGALIVPETVHDDEEDRDRPADGKEKDEEDEETGDEADGDEDDDVQHRFIKHEDGKWVIYSEKGKKLGEYGSEEEAKKRLEQIEYFKHEGERSLIEVPELPSLANARTFAEVFHSLRQDEVEFRNLILKKMQERFDWYFGKV